MSMRMTMTLAAAGAMLLGAACVAHAEPIRPAGAIQVQYQPPGYGPPPGYPPPVYPPPGYGPPPGYPPPPPPGYGPPGYERREFEHERGFHCEAYFRTPEGPRRVFCPLEEPRPIGRHCECAPPPPPPGYPPLPPPEGHVVR